jgi:hypothetical protein
MCANFFLSAFETFNHFSLLMHATSAVRTALLGRVNPVFESKAIPNFLSLFQMPNAVAMPKLYHPVSDPVGAG